MFWGVSIVRIARFLNKKIFINSGPFCSNIYVLVSPAGQTLNRQPKGGYSSHLPAEGFVVWFLATSHTHVEVSLSKTGWLSCSLSERVLMWASWSTVWAEERADRLSFRISSTFSQSGREGQSWNMGNPGGSLGRTWINYRAVSVRKDVRCETLCQTTWAYSPSWRDMKKGEHQLKMSTDVSPNCEPEWHQFWEQNNIHSGNESVHKHRS